MNILLIDLGSNAMRASTYFQTPKGLRKVHDFRFPIRLGDDVFRTGAIGAPLTQELIMAFKELLLLCVNHNITYVMALATSALREASNRNEIIERVDKITGIKITPISGTTEAKLVFQAVKNKVIAKNNYTLLIDMGGGSCELVLCGRRKILAAKSFALGTVRLLEQNNLTSMEKIVEQHKKIILNFFSPFLEKKNQISVAIGTGGNLRTLRKLRKKILKKSESTRSDLKDIKQIYKELVTHDYFERMEEFDLKSDRADVIIPATLVIMNIMQWFNIKEIQLSDQGLKEGMLHTINERLALFKRKLH
jgi:exopolyphosphatase/guanosine-5'-triphosphate,3'-diphosphate pyrophosphatase